MEQLVEDVSLIRKVIDELSFECFPHTDKCALVVSLAIPSGTPLSDFEEL